MDMPEKKIYLGSYRLQQAKIIRLTEMISAYPDAGERYAAELSAARCLRNKIEDEIDAVDGGVLSELLAQKYLLGKSLEETAYSMNYSKRQIERLHLQALERFSAV